MRFVDQANRLEQTPIAPGDFYYNSKNQSIARGDSPVGTMSKIISISICIIGVATALLLTGCAKKNALTIYTSVDQDYAEPIIQTFIDANPEMQINVLYDNEKTKTTGVFERIRREARNPQADVFWNSEIVRTIQLKQEDLLAPYLSPSAAEIPAQFKDSEGYWTGFSVRARVMLINRDLVPKSETPNSIPALGSTKIPGKRAMAVPAFGTTATHMAALYTKLGEMELIKQIGTARVFGKMTMRTSNSDVRDGVANGELAFGLTDTDDAFAAIDAGKPVEMVYLDHEGQGTLVIPNTVALIKNALHPENGQAFIDYILSPEVERKLAETRARQIPVRSSVELPEGVPSLESIHAMDIDYEVVAKNIETCIQFLRDKNFF
ncbi:MAG: extracellular solute-binding protein [Candidatus Hinthialibacter antarcticus]|nr:extracellular solute-binding protein [Candidatus Hinthialibacter antarcticus]